MDIIRFFILTEKELIIYPPEDSSKIYINGSNDLVGYKCNDSNNPILEGEIPYYSNYYSCIHYWILKEIYSFNGLDFLQDIINYNDFIYSICIPYTYYKEKYFKDIICLDVNFGLLINSIDYIKTKNFDFGLMRITDSDTSYFGYEASSIYNTNRNINDVIKIFNSSEYTPKEFVIKDERIKTYHFYYILYFETTRIIKSHPGLKVKVSDLENEYKHDFIEKLSKMLIENYSKNNYSYGSVSEKFKKTTCRKKINNNKYECLVDEFKINIIIPFNITINEINEDIIDTNITKTIKFDYLALYSITYTNPEINKDNIHFIGVLDSNLVKQGYGYMCLPNNEKYFGIYTDDLRDKHGLYQYPDKIEGDKIETSGLGGRYSKGIPIGEVDQFVVKKNPIENEATVKTFVDFHKLETVAIIKEEIKGEENSGG